ncbi:hypothetical protein R1flu_001579 [Riccia fluitans]|uniref:Uncharacterized protein n=1 Tax=Riccia fluitans TaxID=41844 RepID=A0ABD1Y3P0_9MARC
MFEAEGAIPGVWSCLQWQTGRGNELSSLVDHESCQSKKSPLLLAFSWFEKARKLWSLGGLALEEDRIDRHRTRWLFAENAGRHNQMNPHGTDATRKGLSKTGNKLGASRWSLHNRFPE